MVRKNKLVFLGILGTISVIVFAGFFISANNNAKREKYTTLSSANLTGNEAHSFLNWGLLSDDERMSLLADSCDKVDDTEKAARDFRGFKLPRNNLGRKLLGIYVQRETKQVTVLYDNGLYINEWRKDSLNNAPPDYEKEVKQAKRDKDDGILKSDSLPTLISVNGKKGIGCEPGYNVIDDEKHPRPGFAAWDDNGSTYEVYGYGISLNDLLTVAESIY